MKAEDTSNLTFNQKVIKSIFHIIYKVDFINYLFLYSYQKLEVNMNKNGRSSLT